ncbi:U-box domain-containing protein 33-like isoform X2 [Ananas comosus]|nr:U-box domain-containing protein 33-like isoform X2 [Ananas comosus]
MFPASQVSEKEVIAYRRVEKAKVLKKLNEYLPTCEKLKTSAMKLVIEMDDIGRGLEELIVQHRITKLVMGAAEDAKYHREMRAPTSRTAIRVMQNAYPTCKIWFVCKGNLIYVREAREAPPPPPISSSVRNLSPLMSLQPQRIGSPGQNSSMQRSVSAAAGYQQGDPWDDVLPRRPQSSEAASWSASDDIASNSGSSSLARDEQSEVGSVLLPSVHESDSEENQYSSPRHGVEDTRVDADICKKYGELLSEIEKLRKEVLEESHKCRNAQKDFISERQKVKAAMKQTKEIEEALAKEKQENELLTTQRDELNEQVQRADELNLELERRISSSDRAAKELEDTLTASRYLLNSLQADFDQVKRERDEAVREAHELRSRRDQMSSEFSLLELNQATQDFSDSLKIGEGGYGAVYRGFLRNTAVAIKKLHSDSMRGASEFHQEVSILSRVRHPNLVTLIGACLEGWALVYEFLPNGSLEDRLIRANNTPPLSWQTRIRIIGEICTALIFLHTNKPHPIVHGDLKPANILLDANFVSKLGDFGVSRFLIRSNTTTSTTTTLYRTAHPCGTFAYMDPEYITKGELTPKSDVYSFGIIILRLLTGKPPLAITREVEKALEGRNLDSIIDTSAGEWPFVQANQLAHLGVRCAELSRRRRPDLVGEVWRVIQPMMNVASLSASPSFRSGSDGNSMPSYFICPIFQEVMRDPHIAADGFTYEAEAIRGWIESGHDTSPMTNQKLLRLELIPNHTLRSSIQEWRQQHHHHQS